MIGARGGLARVGDNCVRHRPALLGLLEDPLGEDLDAAARAHLDLCPSCRAELAETVLVGVAVRRTMAEAREADPPSDAWPRLRMRIERQQSRRPHGHASSPVLGIALAASMAIALLIPLHVGTPSAGTISESVAATAGATVGPQLARHRDVDAVEPGDDNVAVGSSGWVEEERLRRGLGIRRSSPRNSIVSAVQ